MKKITSTILISLVRAGYLAFALFGFFCVKEIHNTNHNLIDTITISIMILMSLFVSIAIIESVHKEAKV